MTQQAPRYGEYATPEEQRRLAGLPPVEVAASREPEPIADAAPAHGRTGSSVDRLITIALLAYGLVNVIGSAIAYLDLPSLMDRMLVVLGADGAFTNYAQGRLWGGIAAAVLVAGYALTVLVAVRRMIRRRMTWWVPLVGAVNTIIVVAMCVMVPMLSDPAFIDAVLATAS